VTQFTAAKVYSLLNFTRYGRAMGIAMLFDPMSLMMFAISGLASKAPVPQHFRPITCGFLG
jgi:hypothetical protein